MNICPAGAELSHMDRLEETNIAFRSLANKPKNRTVIRFVLRTLCQDLLLTWLLTLRVIRTAAEFLGVFTRL
jgi:hypothetical protein